MDLIDKNQTSAVPLPVIYGGYATSGGTVIRHFLDEFSNSVNFKPEFRILRERFGLIELHHSIFNSRSPENIDLAIKDFLWLVENFARELKRFGKNGGDYDKYTHGQFSIAAREFINEITDFTYPMDWFFYDFKKSRLKSVFDRKMTQLGSKRPSDLAYLCTPEENFFFLCSQKFIARCVSAISWKKGDDPKEFVGLHNAVPPYDSELAELSKNLIGPCKIIFVDRDPRDIYLSLPTSADGRYLKPNSDPEERAKLFVKFYKFLRRNTGTLKTVDNLKQVKFEDLVLDYSAQAKSISKFIGLDNTKHVEQFKFFDPEKSRTGIGKWRLVVGAEIKAISIIEKALEDDLYQL
ncbi:sulfotransferase [Alphaproteobacteria bacterium]|nr:sulfotransferase [Alphaproteobacteria bacterium]